MLSQLRSLSSAFFSALDYGLKDLLGFFVCLGVFALVYNSLLSSEQ